MILIDKYIIGYYIIILSYKLDLTILTYELRTKFKLFI